MPVFSLALKKGLAFRQVKLGEMNFDPSDIK